MALNIQNELDIFDFIVPCGLERVKMTSIWKQTGRVNSMIRVKEILRRLLVRDFSSVEVVEYEKCA